VLEKQVGNPFAASAAADEADVQSYYKSNRYPS
jgi:hypothetical protein